ncbi:hypothetical protein HYX19_01935 [Candidatus Woesearchaeota archaeon]|nr:hypothetical protein [Candidatus Woesearchaeota archaeon]
MLIDGALEDLTWNPLVPSNVTHIQEDRSQGIDNGDYIFMPQHGLYVAKEKAHFNKNWYESHKALHQESARMLTLREFADFLILLKKGNDEFRGIYDHITKAGEPWRAEWLDADFKVVINTLHINYNHRIVNGNLQPQNSEPLTSYLSTNETLGISLDDWLSNPTLQGLPRVDIKEGNLNYWYPRFNNNSVARFDVHSNGADLNYCGNPSYAYFTLGVRAAKIRV